MHVAQRSTCNGGTPGQLPVDTVYPWPQQLNYVGTGRRSTRSRTSHCLQNSTGMLAVHPRREAEHCRIVRPEWHVEPASEDSELGVRVELADAESRGVVDPGCLQPRPPRGRSRRGAPFAVLEGNDKVPARERATPRVDSAGESINAVIRNGEDARQA